MLTNTELVNKFYTAFQYKDFETMNSCYSNDIVFSDPIFGLIKGDAVKAMWEMLCKNAIDFSLSFDNIIELDTQYATCNWIATYTFSKSRRKVINHIKAYMKFADGQIIEHSDAFSLHKWSIQALGFSGWLFGWNTYFQNKIKNNAKRNLINFMQKS